MAMNESSAENVAAKATSEEDRSKNSIAWKYFKKISVKENGSTQ